ncbi:MAG: hypothetical protein JOZ41_15720, partial [Chloroflexi bacterium]|nr:hypothetical protein [Chloroflexota bacterium]
MPTSEKQIQANRRNALHSTGPRSEQGKTASRRNALKHGVFAHQALIEQGEAQEDRARFTALLREARRALRPEGIVEEMLVEQIAVGYWRLRRVLRSEVGEIRSA